MLLTGGAAQGHSGEDHDAAPGGMIQRSGKAVRLSVGATVYKHMCSFCHGLDGNGGGRATDYLYPWPRDFRKGVFKHRSTPSGSLPLDRDIYRTIMQGVPGTAMPAWESALSEEEAWSVIEYIKNFSGRFKNEVPKSAIDPGPVPSGAPEAVAAGKGLYGELRCQRCHGADLMGSGSMADNLFDIWDHRVFVYDLNNPNTYKWGFSKRDIFMT
ncbi:MAG: c-type cytochrome, partial [Nitrospinaceae bacterium]